MYTCILISDPIGIKGLGQFTSLENAIRHLKENGWTQIKDMGPAFLAKSTRLFTSKSGKHTVAILLVKGTQSLDALTPNSELQQAI